MRYERAVEKLRILAEACEHVKPFWFDTEPFLKAVYACGEVVDGAGAALAHPREVRGQRHARR